MRLEFTGEMTMLDVAIAEVTDHTQKSPTLPGGVEESGVLGSASLDLAG